MFMAPGTHKKHLPHEDTFDADNMLTRGQRVVEGIDKSAAVAMPLKTGEMSLHNVRIAHSSKPNRTPDRRIGIAFRFMPASTRQQLADGTAPRSCAAATTEILCWSRARSAKWIPSAPPSMRARSRTS